MALATVSLDDKYQKQDGRVYLTGIQALVRLPLMQRQRDRAAGLNTGGFISGYRGSPLGGYDQQLARAWRFLQKENIHLQAGLNEELAATAVWGTQQTNLFRGATVDGVFGIWYGKGPGVDRSGDVFKHGNSAGSTKHGGVLVLAGDDHTCKSSTLAHQSEYAMMDAMIPVFNPSGVQEVLDMGLHGIALSRYSGLWAGMKTIAETMDSSASITVDPTRALPAIPTDFEMPAGGLNIRWPDTPLVQEERLHRHKIYAGLAYVRANGLNYVAMGSDNPRFGIVTTGKSYLDVLQALEDLHLDDETCRAIGIAIYKVGVSWPLERDGIRKFAEGLDEILVVEEKRAVIENQLKEQLYNWDAAKRPRVVGKFDEKREWILPSNGELTPARIARVIARRLDAFEVDEAHRTMISDRLDFLARKERSLAEPKTDFARTPYFCSGCPHNTSTLVPEGSRALAGIGCHYMAQWMDRSTDTFTQMGGEGVPWIGQAPFTSEKHVFANLGDGTYNHSGILAIRFAVASKVNITYKILYNDAVAMTGGQTHEGGLTVTQIAAQLRAEGVDPVVVVSDEPEKYGGGADFPPGTRIEHRDDLDAVQKDLREQPGVSALIYDQTCAAEKRRRRKRGKMPDPPKRVFINDLVCEGCGDCGVKSNCVSIVPKETPFGRKRAIDQSSCNKDYSCLKGFCPSFVTVHGGKLRKQAGAAQGLTEDLPALPEPKRPGTGSPYSIVITGVGGTGVVTIGALLGMAGHLEGKGVSVLDMTGLAQKGGAVTTHFRIADRPEQVHAMRIAAGGADLLLGCDLVVSASEDCLAKLQEGRAVAVVDSHETMTGDFTRKPDLNFPSRLLRESIIAAVGEDKATFMDSRHIAGALLGNSIAGNLFLLGVAYQKGCIPVSADAIEKAIELNGVAVAFNKQAFGWGRRAVVDPEGIERMIGGRATEPEETVRESLNELVARRADFLTDYQDKAYADRYRAFVDKVAAAEEKIMPGQTGLSEAVAKSYFKLLAIKDEFEVARLFADRSFQEKLSAQFEGDYTLEFHLAPPLLASRDLETGELQKQRFGPWMMTVFRWLARARRYRGSWFDPFSRTEERQMERGLIGEFEAVIGECLERLGPETHATAIRLAQLPQEMRGFGHVKEQNVSSAKEKEAELLHELRNPAGGPTLMAAE